MQAFRTFTAALAVFFAGCEPSGIPEASDAGVDAGYSTKYTITATMPAGFITKWFIVNGVGLQHCPEFRNVCDDFPAEGLCANVGSCTIHPQKPMIIKINVGVDDYIFATVFAKVDEEHPNVSVTWGTGTYGVQIGKGYGVYNWATYTSNNYECNGAQVHLYTYTDNPGVEEWNLPHKVFLMGDDWAVSGAAMTDHDFSATFDNGSTVNGTINASKSTIAYTFTRSDGTSCQDDLIETL